jgi:hypothetical protein
MARDNMLRDNLESRRLKEIFDKVVEPQVVDKILGGSSLERPLTASSIEYVIASVRFQTPEQVSKLIGRVIEISTQHQASIHGPCASVVVAAFGGQPHSPTKPGVAAELVAELIADLGPEIKIVHGTSSGYFGCFGSGNSSRFSFVVPEFESSLALLTQTEFGAAQEFKL